MPLSTGGVSARRLRDGAQLAARGRAGAHRVRPARAARRARVEAQEGRGGGVGWRRLDRDGDAAAPRGARADKPS